MANGPFISTLPSDLLNEYMFGTISLSNIVFIGTKTKLIHFCVIKI